MTTAGAIGVTDAGTAVGARVLPPVPTEAPGLGLQRAFDVVAGAVIVALVAPLMLACAAAIRVEGGGPVLFRQVRLGLGRRPFTCLKFRTMRPDADPAAHRAYIEQLANDPAAAGPGLKKLTRDPRVTRVGAVLRKLSLDELPQLLNVLAGHMSLVGPRPAIDYELEHYRSDDHERFAVRPGLTGLWQVSGRNRLGFLEMLELDAEYARTRSLWLDIRILLRTPGALAGGAA